MVVGNQKESWVEAKAEGGQEERVRGDGAGMAAVAAV